MALRTVLIQENFCLAFKNIYMVWGPKLIFEQGFEWHAICAFTRPPRVLKPSTPSHTRNFTISAGFTHCLCIRRDLYSPTLLKDRMRPLRKSMGGPLRFLNYIKDFGASGSSQTAGYYADRVAGDTACLPQRIRHAPPIEATDGVKEAPRSAVLPTCIGKSLPKKITNPCSEAIANIVDGKPKTTRTHSSYTAPCLKKEHEKDACETSQKRLAAHKR